jgi:5-methylcytosine-specific restriction endonuclease McrA
VTDHVIPHKGDMAVFWDRAQWQSACTWHHDVVKQRLELRYAKGELKAADLWLNSTAASELTRRLDP